MKIGIMLRHFQQHGGGVRVYTHNLMRELLALGSNHEFVLLYRDPALIGTYAGGLDAENVREVAIRAPSAFVWDQLAVRRAEKREKLDLIFNPKYSVPLNAECPCVFVCHGLDWYVMPWGSKWMDGMNHRHLMPRYARKARGIITVSDVTRDHVMKYLGVPRQRLHTVYHGVNEAFQRPVDPEQCARVRRQYHLPDRYFLYVGQVYPPKNVGRLLQAYARIGPARGVYLVMAGEHRWLSERELALVDKLNLRDWIIQTGWIESDTLPAFYHQAEALALPSLYESFGIPLIEAMSMGCPVVTANQFGTRELAEGVGILVDPEDVASIASGLEEVLDDPSRRQRMIEAGRRRAAGFSWRQCARQTLAVLEAAAEPRVESSLRQVTI